MNNSIVKDVFLFVLAVLVFGINGFAQAEIAGNSKAKNTGEVPNGAKLVFSLSGSPKLEDVGFDYRKSYWKLKYELRLLPYSDYFRVRKRLKNKYEKRYGDGLRRIKKVNKKLYKKVRKLGFRVVKGKFKKKRLIAESNRNIEIPFLFPPKVRKILAKAIEPNVRPIFVIRFNVKIYGKTKSKRKTRKKTKSFFLYPVKKRIKGELFIVDYDSFGASFDIYLDGKRTEFSVFKN